MPTLIEIFLSKYIFVLLLWMYITSVLVIVIGFKLLKIKHRFDVVLRGIIMHGTYIFLCHSIGIMFMIIMFIFIKINSFAVNGIGVIFVTIISAIISNFMYIITSSYLWERLAISKKERRDLTLYGLIITTPWYFLLNLT